MVRVDQPRVDRATRGVDDRLSRGRNEASNLHDAALPDADVTGTSLLGRRQPGQDSRRAADEQIGQTSSAISLSCQCPRSVFVNATIKA